MAEQAQRRYLSVDAFREVMRGAKDTPGLELQTENICLLRPMASEVKALGAEGSRLIEFIISTGDVDREQDTIDVGGWDFKDYLKNPVVLFGHDHYSLPVGNARSVYVDGDYVKSICEFVPQDLDGGFGFMVYQFYAQKYMHAVSVGFQPQEYTFAEDRKFGINFKKQALLEYSCVPVPANPNAIAVARSKGINTAPLQKWAEQILDDSTSPKALSDDARRRLEVLRAASSPDGRALILEIGGLKMARSAETDAPPSTDATQADDAVVVKRVVSERWDCGEEAHTHGTEDEAKACKRFDVIVDGVGKAIDGMLVLVKAGRVLSAANEERIRTAVTSLTDVLSQLENAAEEDANNSDGKSGVAVLVTESATPEDVYGIGEIMRADPGLIERTMREVMDDSIRTLTGRLD